MHFCEGAFLQFSFTFSKIKKTETLLKNKIAQNFSSNKTIKIMKGKTDDKVGADLTGCGYN